MPRPNNRSQDLPARLAGLTWPGWLTYLVLAVFALGGVAVILYLTDIAPWAYSDSTAYLAVARNIAAGRGVVLQEPNGPFNLYTWHPPLYPLALSLPIALGVEALQAARWLNAVLFGLTVFLAGWATFRFTRSFWLSTGAAGLILASFDPLNAYAGVMSEGMFVFWSIFSLALLALAIQTPARQNRLLVFAGLAAGLAVLTRYTGLAVLAAGALSALLLIPGRFGQRIKQTLLFLLPGGLLAGTWLLPMFFATRTLGSRQLEALTGLPEKLKSYQLAFMDVIGSWLPFYYRGNHILTPPQKLIVACILLAVLVFLAGKWIRKRRQPFNQDGQLTWACILGIFCIAYVGLHLATYLAITAQPDVNGRLLLPLFIGGALLAAAVAAYLSRILPRSWIGGLIFAALALLSVWYFHSKVQNYLFEMHHFGQGFTSKRWLNNPMLVEIDALDPQIPLYSNNPALVLFYTERFPAALELDPTGTIYDLQIPPEAGLVLFTNAGLGGTSEAYGSTATAASQSYRLIYENEIGYIFLPK